MTGKLEPPFGFGMKILIADDDTVSRRVLTHALEKLGHTVAAFENGRTALEYFCAEKPRVVVSDWMMPEVDGLEFCRRIRELKLEEYTFFILLTANVGDDKYRQAMEEGVDDFLQKPVNREELAIKLRVAARIIQQRNEAEERIRLLARFPADNPNPILHINRPGEILYANKACLPLFAEWQCRVGQPAPPKLRALVEMLFHSDQRQEIEINCADRFFSFSATSICQADSTYLYGHDVTDRKRAEQELIAVKNQAVETSLHDQLTGLPNRHLFGDRLAQSIGRAQRQKFKLALVMVDIDNFKQINDAFGHKVGDQVLVLVGQCLRETLRTVDTVCRWGGDELILLLSDLTDDASVSRICAKLMAAVKQCVLASDITAPVSLSLGSAVFPDDSDDSNILMQQADHALYVAKSDGRDCWREFKGFPDSHNAHNKADLFIRLTRAVEHGEITVYHQPIIDAATRQVAGTEALARWHDEVYGWVSPDVFIPLAEEKGLILKLGHQVIRRGLDQLCEWHRRGHAITLSVNLSKRQILDAEFAGTLIELTHERNLDPQSIILEITERQSLLTHSLGRQSMVQLAAAGFHLSLDDFGSGFSSFDLVGEAPFDELKINQALVHRCKSPKGRRIVQAIVEMSKTLGLRVVAEGVEDAGMQELLTGLGVHKLQGYLFSKPLAETDFLDFLEHYPGTEQISPAA